MNMKTRWTMTMAAIGVMSLGAAANATMIGVNYQSGSNGTLSADSSTGVVPQVNWNNPSASSSSVTNVNFSDGTASTMDVSHSGFAGWWWTGSSTTPTQKLFHHFRYYNTTGATVTASQVPFATYDVYVYLTSDAANRNGQVSIGSTTYYWKSNGNWNSFDLVTSTTAGTHQLGNYVVFANVSGSSFTMNLKHVSGGGDIGFAGFQVVEVPEPATVALLGIGGLLLAGRKRRA